MPITHHPLHPAPEQTDQYDRFITVGLYPEFKPKKPWLRIQGLWLLKAGFTPKLRVRISVSPGRLVITPDDSVQT